ncbi:MAG: outer membrane beta-barrel protein [Prevotella sp.]|nr:outer membrane beta-barrel protein [Prevotella sp.]
MRSILVWILLLAGVAVAKAQDDQEYRMEIGAGGGLVNYLGDYNGSLFGSMQPMGTLTAKYRKNPYSGWALGISYGQLKGKLSDAGTWYVDEELLPTTFSHGLIDVSVRYEYNFWAYGTGREYHGARPLAPFIAFGLGVTHASASPSVFTMNVPLGFGVKYKVADRLNLTGEWMMHFSGSDKLDGVADPLSIKSSGLFKNTDCYSALQLTLTYDIWAKCRTCHNDRD